MVTLSNIPSHLRIRILYSDDDVVVIDKPCDLRSVPGHANPPPTEKAGPRSADAADAEAGVGGGGGNDIAPESHRKTAQEAWVKAIQLISVDYKDPNSAGGEEDAVATAELMRNLGTTADPSCVPRKLETFIKYCHRNSKRLLPSFPNLHVVRGKDISNNMDQCWEQPKQKKPTTDGASASSSMLRCISHDCYVKIQTEQRLLINLPKPTEDWESAIGQLRILGFGDCSHCVSSISENTNGTDSKKLFVVHRLDCQTSGIMIVARNQVTASFLCRAWRERASVEKVYLAHVRHWPPYHQHGILKGTIDLTLAPSRTERIKWEVTPVEEGGKECQTFWKVFEDFDMDNNVATETSQNNSQNTARGITLELHPLTGRTHQLRIHCAAVGSGIVGDSLYGDSPIAWVGDDSSKTKSDSSASSTFIASVKTLRLHAHRLSFPTMARKKMTFESPKSW